MKRCLYATGFGWMHEYQGGVCVDCGAVQDQETGEDSGK